MKPSSLSKSNFGICNDLRNLGSFRTVAIVCLLAFCGNGFGLQSPDLSGIALFPTDNYWHWDISKFPVHANSSNLVASVGSGTSLHPDFGTVYAGAPIGIPYILVDKTQPKIPINFTEYGDESDPGPYPIPLDAPIEGGNPNLGDRHVLAVDKDAKMLYELYIAQPQTNSWNAACGAKFDLTSNALRPETWTSADAAGLPILPGLVRYDEIARGVIDHAIRMTVVVSRKSYIWPARHQAGSTTSLNAPPMGQRYRLRADFDTAGYPRAAKIVLVALKKYGAIVADNGGNWYLSGAPDDRMPDEELNALKQVKGRDFEAIQSVDESGNPLNPLNPTSLISPRHLGTHLGTSRGANSVHAVYDWNGRLVPISQRESVAPRIQGGSEREWNLLLNY